MIYIDVTSKPKLKALFNQASSLTFLEHKTLSGESATIQVSKNKPFKICYSKTKERLSVTFSMLGSINLVCAKVKHFVK